MPAPTSRRGPPRVPSPFLGLQPPRLNPGCDGRRGRRDSRPVSSPQVGPGAARPARACGDSGGSGAGRRPGPLSWDPRREKGSPLTPTGSPAGTLPGPHCPAPRPGAHSVPQCDPRAHPARPPIHPPSPRAWPCLPFRGGRRRRPLSGAEEAPAAGREAASSPRPRRQRLEPGSCKRAGCRARLLCE